MKKIIFICFLLGSFVSNAQLKIGDKAPDFKLWLTNDDIITQEDTKGKVLIFKTWFTTCAPCVSSIPSFNALIQQFKGNENVIFIAPAIDRSDIVKRFVSKVKIDCKVAYSANDVIEKYNTKGVFPSYFIVDKKGNMAHIDSQTKMIDENTLATVIKELLAK